jgi:hypothetical protein
MGPLVIFSMAGLNGEMDRSCWVYVRWASQFLETFFDNVAETAARLLSIGGQVTIHSLMRRAGGTDCSFGDHRSLERLKQPARSSAPVSVSQITV